MDTIVIEDAARIRNSSVLAAMYRDPVRYELIIQEVERALRDTDAGVVVATDLVVPIRIAALIRRNGHPNPFMSVEVVAVAVVIAVSSRRVKIHVSSDAHAHACDEQLCARILQMSSAAVRTEEARLVSSIFGTTKLAHSLATAIAARRRTRAVATTHTTLATLRRTLTVVRAAPVLEHPVTGGLCVMHPTNASQHYAMFDVHGHAIAELTREFCEAEDIEYEPMSQPYRSRDPGDLAIFVCDATDEVVGMAGVSWRGDHFARIGPVCVLASWRRRGVALACMPALLNSIASRSDGGDGDEFTFTLYLRSGNTAAARLYDALGFVDARDDKAFVRITP
jgi:GNAT superfamily N-acetyltransferase